jgi:hypothetical protein
MDGYLRVEWVLYERKTLLIRESFCSLAIPARYACNISCQVVFSFLILIDDEVRSRDSIAGTSLTNIIT